MIIVNGDLDVAADEFTVLYHVDLLWIRLATEQELDAYLVIAVDVPTDLGTRIMEVADAGHRRRGKSH